MANAKKSYVIIAVSGGFYFFGHEIASQEGYLTLADVSMFGSFGGGKGLPGVARGDSKATVVLDRFANDAKASFPITSVLAIMDSVNLYDQKTTTLR